MPRVHPNALVNEGEPANARRCALADTDHIRAGNIEPLRPAIHRRFEPYALNPARIIL